MEQPVVRRNGTQQALLTYWQDEQEQHISVGTGAWYAWLETARIFRFISDEGTFSAHKARSGNGRGGWYWRAHRRRQGRLLRCYLGKSEDLDLQRLTGAARQLSGAGPVVPPEEAPLYPPTLAEEDEMLVLTRLFIPRLSIQHIPRPHLLALLDRAVQTSMLILVSAPAGSGTSASG